MPFKMAALKRAKSGAYKARKAIPKDVQAEYAKLYNHGFEAKTTYPSSLSPSEAKARHAEWLSEIETRIQTIRAQQRGLRQSLTQRQTFALAGEWYRWFIAQHEENPGTAKHWEQCFWAVVSELEEHTDDPAQRGRDLEWTRDPEVRAAARPAVAKGTAADQFLASRGGALTDDSYGAFLDALVDEYVAAVLLLERRAKGDYSADERLAELPTFVEEPKAHKHTLVTPWELFGQWIAAQQPNQSTVNRWRTVFLGLTQHFESRSASSISPDEAQAWADQLLTDKRSARTVNQIYCSAASTVFGWGVKSRKLTSNPFKGVGVTQPRQTQTRETKEFTDQEVTLILRASLEFQNTPKRTFDAARRWVPWLCAYTGARAGEMTQLRGLDISQQHGTWVVQITPDAGTVKTRKPRTVPLHEHLVAQGFIEFVRASGKGPLFYNATSPTRTESGDPTNPKRPRSVKTRERMASWVRDIGVTDTAIRPNHAWRHTFKRRAARAGIERGIRDAICGHSPRDVADEYETPTVADMATALKRFPRYELYESKSMSASGTRTQSRNADPRTARTKKSS